MIELRLGGRVGGNEHSSIGSRPSAVDTSDRIRHAEAYADELAVSAQDDIDSIRNAHVESVRNTRRPVRAVVEEQTILKLGIAHVTAS